MAHLLAGRLWFDAPAVAGIAVVFTIIGICSKVNYAFIQKEIIQEMSPHLLLLLLMLIERKWLNELNYRIGGLSENLAGAIFHLSQRFHICHFSNQMYLHFATSRVFQRDLLPLLAVNEKEARKQRHFHYGGMFP